MFPRIKQRMFVISIGIMTVLFIVSVVLASLLFFLAPRIIENKIKETARLGYDRNHKITEVTRRWRDPKYDVYFQVYTFSVKNADEVIKNHRLAPLFVEKGPYSFKETLHKEANFSSDGSRVTYRTRKTYQFDPRTSCKECNLDNYVTIPNLALQGAWRVAQNDLFAKGIIGGVLKKNPDITTFVNVRVGELLFTGYEDKLSTILKEKYPMLIPTTRIALFMDKNDSLGYLYEVDTGSKNLDSISKIYSWNCSTTTSAWYKPEAKVVRGLDGQMFPPKASLDSFEVFVGDLCRSIKFDVKARDRLFDDLTVVEYQPSDISIEDEQTIGYCNPNATRFFDSISVQPEHCSPIGLLDMSSCDSKATGILIGQPHFRGSPEAIRNQAPGVRDWNPEEITKIHIGNFCDSSFSRIPGNMDPDTEPLTGVVVHFEQLTQINYGVVEGNFTPISDLSRRIMPLIWINETGVYDKGTRDELRSLFRKKLIILIVGIFFYGFAAVLLVATSILVTRRVWRKKNRQTVWINPTQEPDSVSPPPPSSPSSSSSSNTSPKE